MKKIAIVLLLVLSISVVFTACANFDFEEEGNYIVSADEVAGLIDDGAILVAVCAADDYGVSHIDGAINIPMSLLMTNEPYKNMIPKKEQVEDVMSQAGVSESDMILVYDDASNMQAARVQWTLNYYGNLNVKVISGGMQALLKEGFVESKSASVLDAKEYKTGTRNKKLLVKLSYIDSILNMPEENTYIIDTRSFEEFSEGTISGAIHIEYIWNNYGNGEYKSPRDIQLTYIQKDIMPDDKLILFCKTSVRAAQTYSALKDAGYKDVRVYDGAWLEYEAEKGPAKPSLEVTPEQGNAS